MADLRKIKLGFLNPLVPGDDDMSFDPYDLQDSVSAHQVISAQEDVFKRRNVFKGMTEFTGLVILAPTVIGSNSGFMDVIGAVVGNSQQYWKFKIHIPELHAALGNPCDVGNLGAAAASQAKQLMKAEKIIEHHPWIITKLPVSWTGNAIPKFGDIVKVKFTKGPSGGKQVEGEFVGIISSGNADSIKSYCNMAIYEQFNTYNSGATPSGGSNTTPAPLTLQQEELITDCRNSIENESTNLNPYHTPTPPSSDSPDSIPPIPTASLPVNVPANSPFITETDETKYFVVPSTIKFSDLSADFQQKITVMAKVFNCVTNGGKVEINSGRRTKAQQQELYDTWSKIPATNWKDPAGNTRCSLGTQPNLSGCITTPRNTTAYATEAAWQAQGGHASGDAIDCNSKPIIAALGGDLSQYGLKWGGTFDKKDDVHIEKA